MIRTLFRRSAVLVVVSLLSILCVSGPVLASSLSLFAGEATPVAPLPPGPEDDSPPPGDEPASQFASNGDEGGLSSAATASQITLDQQYPFRNGTISVASTFNLVDTDAGAVILTTDIPAATTFNNDLGLMCSISCNGYSSGLTGAPPLSVAVNYNAGGAGGVTQTITVSFSVTVASDAPYNSELEFSAVGDTSAGSRLYASAFVAEPLEAQDATYDVAYERSYSGTVTSTGGVGDVFYEQASLPSKGSVTVSYDGSFTYTAGSGQTGQDQFDFLAYDSRNPRQESTGTIILNISDPVVANDTSLAVDFEGSGTGVVTATGGVGGLTFAVQDEPGKGSVIVNPDGSFEYSANANVTGADQFTVIASDTSTPPLTDVATVEVTIGPPPALTANPLTIEVSPGATITGNLAAQVTGGILPYTFTLASQADQGVATIDGTGSFTFVAGADATGIDSFTYAVTDSNNTTQVTDAATTTGTVNVVYVAAPTATATPPPATATMTPTTERPVIPGRTATPTPEKDTEPSGNAGSGDGSGTVSQLPSTGQGNSDQGVPMLLALSLAALGLLCLALVSLRRTR